MKMLLTNSADNKDLAENDSGRFDNAAIVVRASGSTPRKVFHTRRGWEWAGSRS
jgi:hypothetical protein